MKKFIYSLFVLACAVMAFSSCEDVPAPYNMPQEVIDEIVEPSGSGTAEDPYNAVAANQLGESLEADANSETVYVKGIVSRIDEVETEKYGNAIFYISEYGTTNNQFYVFHCYGLGGEKFTSEDELKVGDEVIVCGQITNFKGNTVELAQGGYIYSLNGTVVPKDDQSTAEPEGEGTLESPYNVAKALDVIASTGGTGDEEVYIKGKVSQIGDLYTPNGSLTYYISDDGSTTGQLKVYGGFYLNGEKFSSEDQLKEGDEVVIRGTLTQFHEDTEVGRGNVLISINGQTGEGGSTGGSGVTISGNTVTLTNSAVTAGSETATFVVADQGFTNAQKMSTVTMSDGSVITFDNNGEQNGSAYYDSGKSIRVYKNNIMHFSCKKPIAKIVITCRNESYTGNKTATFTINGKEAEYNNVFTEEKGGGIQMHFTNIEVTYAK